MWQKCRTDVLRSFRIDSLRAATGRAASQLGFILYDIIMDNHQL